MSNMNINDIAHAAAAEAMIANMSPAARLKALGRISSKERRRDPEARRKHNESSKKSHRLRRERIKQEKEAAYSVSPKFAKHRI